MSNSKHVDVLKSGPVEWNSWRAKSADGRPDLCEANLSRMDLKGYDLSDCNMLGTILSGCDLREVNLARSDLRNAVFANGIGLHEPLTVDHVGATVSSGANLEGGSLAGADIRGACFTATKLVDVDFEETLFGGTVLARCDLTRARNLTSATHKGPGSIDIRTIERSDCDLTEIMQGFGYPAWAIESMKLLSDDLTSERVGEIVYRIHDHVVGAPIKFGGLFLSYSHADADFVDVLQERLDRDDIRSWRDIHDAPAGPLEDIVLQSIRDNPCVLVVLSENSDGSDWVEHEAMLARELEKERDRFVLCPISLDDSWQKTEWSHVLMTQLKKYNILDFSKWKNAQEFEKQYNLLREGLAKYYGVRSGV